ncbi:MAG: formylglycine-generating enzyme family protein [Candidatus Omnitrophota bacterium]
MFRNFTFLLLLPFFFASASLAPASNSKPKTWRNPKDGMIFVWIPAGSFTAEVPRAVTETVTYSKERVEIEQGFWMAKTETAVKQFRSFVRETGYVSDAEKAGNKFNWKTPGFKQRENYPVVYISFADAQHYAEWAGVDLPTETEWLYACRAGSETVYYWGDEFDDRNVWHRGNSLKGSHTVAAKQPNAWGLYDMVGNAWEYAIICDGAHIELGGSWTRCFRYKTRQGFVADNLFAGTIAPRLSPCKPPLSYPWDDDRGFRCVKRAP